ncbi:NfeD family protein [Rubrivirga sp. S365]|uniref:NfeD family protein n=1 Tax=Rubrivirga litoralis TaxID=3075598 RepID=A0ABU3BS33_9BACT|nr:MULTISPECIES: NfeD family protein [unclassified Rubrivirga]MDT0632096.1 NfeD family protein [Rubrivirga sp. F394]MDT7856175.1 NfeD family protein [Rubrivirga sp. S365]
MELLIPALLILVGLALVAVEVTVVPGLNAVGVLGVVGAAVGVVYAFVELGWAGGLATLAATLLAAGGVAYLLWDSGAWDRFVLSDSLRRDADADAEEHAGRARMLGQTGTALTPLRPGGVAEVGGARLEVETEGAFVAAGSRVRVVALDRRRFIVRVVEE